ncbi:MAG: YeaH/YhbH family protein [Pseudomonadota bacterium]
MSHFIDRRPNGKGKSTVNRQRFIRRYKQQIKRSVADAIGNRSVTDIESGEQITIPKRDVSEPLFHTGKGGSQRRVLPGNDQFAKGDKIKRPPQGGGQGSGEGDASNSGEGEDDFVFSLSKDEYLDILFDGLELPNLKKTTVDSSTEFETFRAGYQTEGIPSNLDIVRSLKGAVARKIAMTSGSRKELKQLEEEYQQLLKDPHHDQAKLLKLEDDIEHLKQRIAKVPFIDTFDLRFRNYEKRPVPSSQAVMFCLMDVSGSMDQATKDIAKRFYILLYLFLTARYDNVEVVYIRHHTQAKEVDEHTFFYSQETGGTIVSSALKAMHQIVKDRYDPAEWNIYAAQASDGDNWSDDSPLCRDLLEKELMPLTRFYAYIEITTRDHQSLWREYQKVSATWENFVCKHIVTVDDILPVFRELFSTNAEMRT